MISAPPVECEVVASKNLNRALNRIDHLFKGINNIPSRENLALAKRYAKFEVCVCVEFRFAKVPAREFVAVFQRKGDIRSLSWREGRRIFIDGDEFDPAKGGGNGHNRSVLVYDVEEMERAQMVAVGSGVNLYGLDEFSCLRRDKFEESLRFDIGPTVIPVYREVDMVHFVIEGGSLRVVKGENHGERIERRHKVVGDIANKRAKVRGDSLSDAEAVDLKSGINLVLVGNDRVWVSVAERFNSLLKPSKVMMCAINLNRATKQRILGHDEASEGRSGINAGTNGRAIAPAA
jgi:hypothetical protein